ncbi:hypothetical protein PybrP1_003055 [[Pythium] brassicae (nom. inval.)]|nr:hypothetical protein PybrP1_003055 [[Pythium] brassicae (nom. inval.)]
MFRFATRASKHRTAGIFGAAFTIRESTKYDTPSELKIAPNQRVEKQFRFGDEQTAAMKIDSLKLEVPGYTRVSYNAIGRENVIRVSSDTDALVDAVRAIPHGSHGLELYTEEPFGSSGHLLIEIFLAQPAEVKEISCAGSSVTVVEDGVLMNNHPDEEVVVKQSGSGDLFVTSGDTLVRSLSLALSGSGSLHFSAPNVVAVDKTSLSLAASGTLQMFANRLETGSAKLGVAGSGEVQLGTQALIAKEKVSASMAGSGKARVFSSTIHTPQVKCSIAGSGDIRVGAQDVLAATSLKSSIAGSGDITIAARTAQCDSHGISIAGSGDVDAGDVAVTGTKVSIIGSGDSIVQAVESIKYSKLGSGTIKHVGPAPRNVSGSGSTHALQQLYRHDTRSVSDRIAMGWKAPTAIPVKEEAFDKITVRPSSRSRHSSSHDYHVEIRSWSDLVSQVQGLFGFNTRPAPMVSMPPMPPIPPMAAPPTGATSTAYKVVGSDAHAKSDFQLQQNGKREP